MERAAGHLAGLLLRVWHPQVWDLHFWIRNGGPPTVAYWNPAAPAGGLALPAGPAFSVEGGQKRPVPAAELAAAIAPRGGAGAIGALRKRRPGRVAG